MQIHVNARHNLERPFACKMCPRRFAKKQNMESHYRTHTNERPFSCTLCTKTFARRFALTRHLRGHLGLKPYPCPYCDRRIADESNFRKHLRNMHPDCQKVKPVADGDFDSLIRPLMKDSERIRNSLPQHRRGRRIKSEF